MNIGWIQVFESLSRTRNFTNTSTELDISQPAVSQRLRKLEQAVGAPLIKRKSRPISLTPVGEQILPFAIQILAANSHMIRAGAVGVGTPIGTVSIGYAGTSVNPHLPRMIHAVNKVAPQIDLQLNPMVYASTTQTMVAEGKLDIAFSRSPIQVPDIKERIFEYERIIVALPEDHPWPDSKPIDIQELQSENWIMFPDAKGSRLRECGLHIAREAGFDPRISQVGPDSYTILGMVAAGLGVTITLSSVTRVPHPGVKLVQLEGVPRYLAATIVHPALPSPLSQIVLDSFATEFPTPKRPFGLIL